MRLLPVLILSAFAQDPVPAPHAVDAFAVTGTPETDAAGAFAAARHKAEDQVRQRWRERAQQVATEVRPCFVPPVLVERALAHWVASPEVVQALRIVDRADKQREHEFGSSYQTTLWVAEEPTATARVERDLHRTLTQVTRRLVATSFGTVVYWGVLALAIAWLDRLSRGYMTGRLRLIGVLLGSAVPALALGL